MAKSKNCKANQVLESSDEFQILDCMITNGDIRGSIYSPDGISVNSKVYEGFKSRGDYYNVDDHGKFSSEMNFNTYYGETKESWEKALIARANARSISREVDEIVSSFLMFLGGLVIRTIGFQINAFINLFTFPIWLMYCSFMFVVDPFRIIKWAHNRTIGVFLGMWCSFCESVIALPVKGQKSLLKMAMKFCWGFFWSAYVCFLLFGLLMLGFVVGGVTMRYIVEEPIQMTENLNFDYTKSSPVALVPIMSCPSVSCGLNCKENIELENYVGSRIIPPNQNLKLTISLTLPESDYNRKLGIFQVKVDLLSTNGEVTASPSYPCMLQFKSQLISYAETFLRSLPLLAGYTSESQTLNINMRGFAEGNEPTSCLKVILEQRAEYQPSSGIPEVYAASLVLESELPLIKKLIWYWRKTIFVWISMASFAVELMFMLIFCRPIIVPRVQSRRRSSKKITHKKDIALIKNS